MLAVAYAAWSFVGAVFFGLGGPILPVAQPGASVHVGSFFVAGLGNAGVAAAWFYLARRMSLRPASAPGLAVLVGVGTILYEGLAQIVSGEPVGPTVGMAFGFLAVGWAVARAAMSPRPKGLR
jgi:predicted metal-binding membrane protein